MKTDTIMSGVVVLLESGSWPIAVLVFVASIVVPLLKILALGLLLYTAWTRSARRSLQRSALYRMVEFIGRWSMLDIYAISLLAALVQIQSFASIIVGWGAWAFGRRGGVDHARGTDFRRAAAVGCRAMTEPANSGLDDLPAAVPVRSRWSRLPLIWILPAVVVLAGAFVVIHEELAQGTSIEIRFHNAEDLEANKTKIRYKDVEIGDVRDIHVSKDRKEVVVSAMIHRDASEYLVDDTRFWVVRPRVSAAGITGLGTLVSGAYISVDVGKSATRSRHFVGVEVPPIVTAGSARARIRAACRRPGFLGHWFCGLFPAYRGRPGGGVHAGRGRHRRHAQGIHRCAL